MSEENNWYERLLNEKSSLDEKIKKLNNFLGGDKSNTVNPDEVVLLRLQLKYMKLYANALNLRIAGTKGEVK
jgi:hypothetical protein